LRKPSAAASAGPPAPPAEQTAEKLDVHHPVA
jgi:hypothetical protein